MIQKCVNLGLLIVGTLGGSSALLAQESQCISDIEALNIQADLQTASLVCLKWNAMSANDFASNLLWFQALSADDLTEEADSGMFRFKEPCASEIHDAELESFQKAEQMGLDAFCISTSVWLTVPAIRQSLKANGVFPVGLE